jgi:hypothetical protein
MENLRKTTLAGARVIGFFALACLFVACPGGGTSQNQFCPPACEAFDNPSPLPSHPPQSWLTHTPGGDPQTIAGRPAAFSGSYYSTNDVGQDRNTFTSWWNLNGFGTIGEVVTYYYNGGDLGYGREMHCRQWRPQNVFHELRTSCYVVNYSADVNETRPFLTPAVPLALAEQAAAINRALDRAVAHNLAHSFAIVAMESQSIDNPFSHQSNVSFYAYNNAGNRVGEPQLDSEDPEKPVPTMCMTCHGGEYDDAHSRVSNASFLPFDLQSFGFSTTPGYTRAEQEEKFRIQNMMVANSETVSPAIKQRIQMMYGPPGDYQIPFTKSVDNRVPLGWQGHSILYLNVARPYCLGCHQAQTPYEPQAPAVGKALDMSNYGDFARYAIQIYNDVCVTHTMPQAEIPYFKFWQKNAPDAGPVVLQNWLIDDGFEPADIKCRP